MSTKQICVSCHELMKNIPWDRLKNTIITITEITIAVVGAIEAIRSLKQNKENA
jgi:hypothetical protein